MSCYISVAISACHSLPYTYVKYSLSPRWLMSLQCVCVGVWVSQEPMNWCNLPSPYFSFFLHEPTIPPGRVQKNPLSTDALLCVPCDVSPSAPDNYRLWRHTGTSSLLTEERTNPDFIERQNLIKSAWQWCSIVVLHWNTATQLVWSLTWRHHASMCQII